MELGDIAELFADFDLTPLASASIAQVHTAKLRQDDGSLADVVIKVIRPDIRQLIDADLQLMSDIAGVVARFVPDARRLRPQEVVAEYRKTIIDELDLQRELPTRCSYGAIS